MVESYSFGRMKIDGKVYTSDMIVFPDRINSSWWRKTGHRLLMEDLREINEEEFDVLIVGTGYFGKMKVDEEVINHAHSKPFEFIMEKTTEAVEKFNDISGRKKVIAAFHLTC